MTQAPADAATPVVSAFYDRFPYPGDPLQDGPPPGYNWRWCVDAAYAACTGALPPASPAGEPLRILDAGCGTGVSTDYLAHLNPGAEILAVDISPGTLEVARERLRRSGGGAQARVRIENRSLLELQGEGPFDYINSVGVLHHLREPEAGLRALAALLKPGALLHLFLYADGGRWEIHRTQRALTALEVGTGEPGLRLGRQLLAELPEHNRLRRHHEQRWALDCAADANFADMYLHPQETSYNLERLMAFVASADLQFAGFSNPQVWDPARLLQGELLERAQALPPLQRWQLVEDRVRPHRRPSCLLPSIPPCRQRQSRSRGPQHPGPPEESVHRPPIPGSHVGRTTTHCPSTTPRSSRTSTPLSVSDCIWGTDTTSRRNPTALSKR